MSDVEFFAAAAISGWVLVPVVYCLGFWLGGRYAIHGLGKRKLSFDPAVWHRGPTKLFNIPPRDRDSS